MNKGGRSPYDAKCNMAEIGAVNMGEIGAVRKRSCSQTGPHDSSPSNTSVYNYTDRKHYGILLQLVTMHIKVAELNTPSDGNGASHH